MNFKITYKLIKEMSKVIIALKNRNYANSVDSYNQAYYNMQQQNISNSKSVWYGAGGNSNIVASGGSGGNSGWQHQQMNGQNFKFIDPYEEILKEADDFCKEYEKFNVID